jgi:hypothetical protein
MRTMRSPSGDTLALLLAGVLVAGCAGKATTSAFTQTSQITGELKRGVSTRMDVRKVLGTPKGSGHAVFPFPPDWRPREVWYYEDLEVTDQLATLTAGVSRPADEYSHAGRRPAAPGPPGNEPAHGGIYKH